MSDTSAAEIAPTRTYRSALRARQAEQTRRRIIECAADLFSTRGYDATTLAAIAREAGVSTETVKNTASKAELLIAGFEVTFSGSEAAETLTDTEVGGGVLDAPDDAFLDAVVSRITTANARGHALWTVLLGAAASDPLVDDALHGILEHRAADYRRLVAELLGRSIASPDADPEAAADELSFLMSPEGYQQLVTQSGWTDSHYRAWLRASVERVTAG